MNPTPAPHTLWRMAYRSHAQCNRDEVMAIAEQARRNNKRMQLTGLLAYVGGSFMQYLEGPYAALQQMTQTLQQDTRHADMLTFVDSATEYRLFDGFSLACSLDYKIPTPSEFSTNLMWQLHSSPRNADDWNVVDAFMGFWEECAGIWALQPAQTPSGKEAQIYEQFQQRQHKQRNGNSA